MTANQRRPGFRLPWSSETDGSADEADPNASAAASAPAAETATATPAAEPSAEAAGEPETADAAGAGVSADKPAATPEQASEKAPTPDITAVAEPAAAEAPPAEPESDASAAEQPPGETKAPAQVAPSEPSAVPAPEPASGDEFIRDLVSAMRRVADEARQTGIDELRSRAEEQVRRLEADAEKRREELRGRTEADVAGIGEWAKAEAERIKAEAEQRVVARRSQLDQQLAGDTSRTETETKAVRDRVAEYERELEAYHAQLAEINDPAAFAAAAKRMPRPPQLVAAALTAGADASATSAASPGPEARTPVEPASGGSNGVGGTAADVHPAEEEVLAARLAQLDATLPSADAPAVATATSTEPVTTEVVVKGLGSFGAITGFRQSLSAVEGIQGVALSLGQTGEFVFRATHAPGFDLRAAITTLEGDNAKIEDRPEGGLRVTLERAR